MARFCRNCGTELPEGAAFCPECGEKAPAAQKERFCRNCGTRLPAGATFCPECGEAVPIEADAPKKVPVTPPKAEAKPEPSPPKAAPKEQPTKAQAKAEPSKAVPAKSAKAKTESGKTEQPQAAAPTTKNSPKKRGLSLFLVIVMLFELGIAAFKYPGFLRKEPTDPYGGYSGSTGLSGGTSSGSVTETVPAAAAEDNGLIEEKLTELDIYQVGTPGVDFAVGTGPESADYQQIDGYGLETVITYSQNELETAPLQTAEVSGLTGLAAFGGITVNFGEEALELERDTLLLWTLPGKTDEGNGYWVTAWNLALTSEQELSQMAAMTVPCDRGQLMNVIPQQYDAALGRWRHIAYTVDAEAESVTMYLEKLAPVGLFALIREDNSSLSAGTTVQDLHIGASFGDLFSSGKTLDEITSVQSRLLRFGLTAQQLDAAISNSKEIENEIKNNYETIQKQIKERSEALYKPGGLLGFVSDNAGTVIDGAGLSASLTEYVFKLDPVTSTLLSGISLSWTMAKVLDGSLTNFFLGDHLANAKKLGRSIGDIAYGAASLCAAFQWLLDIPPFAWTRPEFLLVVGAALLVNNIVLGRMDAMEVQKSDAPTLEQLYLDAPYGNMYWDKTEHKVTWRPSDNLMEQLRKKISSATMGRGEEMVKENPDFEYLIWFEYQNTSPGFFGEESYNGTNVIRYVTLNADFFETYNAMLAQNQEILGNSDRYRKLGALAENTNDWFNAGWRAMLNYIKEAHHNEPEKWYPALMDYLTQTEQVAYEYAYDMSTLIGAPLGTPDFTAEQFKGDILYRLSRRPIFKAFVSDCQSETRRKNNESLASVKKIVNRKIEFKLVDQNGTPTSFNNTQYAGKYIVIETNPFLYTLYDPWTAKMDSDVFCTCTYTGYVLAGLPAALLVYGSKSDYENKKSYETRIPMKKLGSEDKTVTLQITAQQETNKFKVNVNFDGTIPGSVQEQNWRKETRKSDPLDCTVTIRQNGTVTFEIAPLNFTFTREPEMGLDEDWTSETFTRPGFTLTGTVTSRRENSESGRTVILGELTGKIPAVTSKTTVDYTYETNKDEGVHSYSSGRYNVITTANGEGHDGKFEIVLRQKEREISVKIEYRVAEKKLKYERYGIVKKVQHGYNDYRYELTSPQPEVSEYTYEDSFVAFGMWYTDTTPETVPSGMAPNG